MQNVLDTEKQNGNNLVICKALFPVKFIANFYELCYHYKKTILKNLQPGGIFMENERKQKGKVRITSIIALIMCLIDFYIIINFPQDYIILAGAVLITLLFAVLSINSWFKWNDLQGQLRNEQYSDIMNVQKSSYVIVQKKLQDIDDKINFVGQKIMPLEKSGEVHQRKIASILDSIVEDQKKIAKITISRSKENADALMNSNDKLMLQMEEFRNSIAGMQEQLLSRQGEIHSENAEELAKSKGEILGRITGLRELLEKEAVEISENILSSQQSLEESYSNALETAAEVKNINYAKSTKDLEPSVEPVQVQQTVSDSIKESSETAEELPAVDQAAFEEPSIMIDNLPISDPVEEKFAVEDNVISPEEDLPVLEPAEEQTSIVENLPISESKEEQAAVDVIIPEPSVEKDLSISEPIEEQAAVVEDLPEPEPVEVKEQPLQESVQKSAAPNSDEKMSPEDIAALIAKTVTEELPETTEKFQEEQKPPVPDMSDPNRPMSPEDIAALIANM